ncbi:DNA-binding transcriptional MerR regulator [Arthrobacter pigmenti]|uniref:DNA-binding transcriptional MerR regulator n=1 Tax=Arthrobacter pigmenti TaxID=271432 RepID=A0A846RRX8_9MICC|nr:MerR family transcriptional regulator [Arthrobacter pigmenti]NJC21061.1 DNA-binding transcriptional MerR regulator [Arthrobacter pigmenti]
MRTIDVARRVGCSVQLIRNLERDGILPFSARTRAGYRQYAEVHLKSALAYSALAAAVGPVEGKRLVRTVHRGPVHEVLELLDVAHSRLLEERIGCRATRAAVAAISGEHIDDGAHRDSMAVAELAGALGIRTSTLRHWEAEHLITPVRLPPRGARQYTPSVIRDVRIVHQLRCAGYRIDTLQELMPHIREGKRLDDLAAILARREADIEFRSRALLAASSELDALLTLVDAVRD